MVKSQEQYRIAFSALKPGTHSFDFEIESAFFEEYEDTEISGGSIAVNVLMIREERMMDLRFTIKGEVTVACDRCLEPVDIGIDGTERLIIKLGDRYFEESDEIQIIPDTDSHIDLAPFLFEYIHLLLPMRRIHPENEEGESQCDPVVLQKLNDLEPTKEADPRWDALKKLKDN